MKMIALTTLSTVMALAFVGCASSKKQEAAPSSTSAAAPAPAPKAEKTPTKKATKAATAVSTGPSAAGTLECTSGSDKRILEIKPTDAKGCELHYTKMETTSTIATQIEGDAKCVEVQDRIKGKLEAAGYTCS